MKWAAPSGSGPLRRTGTHPRPSVPRPLPPSVPPCFRRSEHFQQAGQGLKGLNSHCSGRGMRVRTRGREEPHVRCSPHSREVESLQSLRLEPSPLTCRFISDRSGRGRTVPNDGSTPGPGGVGVPGRGPRGPSPPPGPATRRQRPGGSDPTAPHGPSPAPGISRTYRDSRDQENEMVNALRSCGRVLS